MVEEEEPLRPQSRVGALVLDSLGIEELQSYIIDLQTEIARVEAVIAWKRAHLGAADSIFRK